MPAHRTGEPCPGTEMGVSNQLATRGAGDPAWSSLARLGSGPVRINSDVISDVDGVAGSVVLATCNRFEVYCDVFFGADPDITRERVLGLIGTCSGVSAEELRRTLDCLTGTALAEHLFSVGSGLDSAVVGEREIPGSCAAHLPRPRKPERPRSAGPALPGGLPGRPEAWDR